MWLDGEQVAQLDGVTTAVTLEEPLGDGAHAWHVVARDAAGNERASNTGAFAVDGTPPAPIELRSPTPGDANLSPGTRFRWAPTSDAETSVEGYELLVDGSVLAELAPEDCGAAECVAGGQTPLAGGAHDWQVRARDEAGNVRESELLAFSVDGQPPEGFSLRSPADEGTREHPPAGAVVA